MLKAVKHLSMNPNLLDVLQNANAIEILVRILDEQSSGPYGAVRMATSHHLTRWLSYLLCPGNVKSYLPNVLQPLPTEQGKAGGGCAGWHYSQLEARVRVWVAAEAIRFANPVRSC